MHHRLNEIGKRRSDKADRDHYLMEKGLQRFNDDAGTSADYIVVEMARHILGEGWMKEFVSKANRGGIERVLL